MICKTVSNVWHVQNLYKKLIFLCKNCCSLNNLVQLGTCTTYNNSWMKNKIFCLPIKWILNLTFTIVDKWTSQEWFLQLQSLQTLIKKFSDWCESFVQEIKSIVLFFGYYLLQTFAATKFYFVFKTFKMAGMLGSTLAHGGHSSIGILYLKTGD